MQSRLHNRSVVLLLACAVVMVGGIAYAGIPDTSGTIHACYRLSNGASQGALRVIDTEAGQTCASGENALRWNQAGPPGPAATSLWVAVEPNAAIVVGPDGEPKQSHVVEVVSTGGLGEYVVRFDRRIDQCSYQATLGATSTFGPGGEITAAGYDTTRVSVATMDSNGMPADRKFFLAVFC